MSYAGNRTCYDADSHIMELPDFLKRYADPGIRDQMPEISYSASLVTDEEVAEIMANGGRHADEHRADMVAMGDDLIRRAKEIQALGAFDAPDRTQALDQLGFAKQLVFATHSVALPFHAKPKDPALRYGATRAHNRHMQAFCADDSRLMGVGIVPLDEPELALQEAQWCIEAGLEAIWVPHRDCGGRSPGHVDLEPFWALLAEAGVPFLLHVGGSPLQLGKAWGNTGRAAVRDWMGGGENVRSKDMAVMHQGPETFISTMVMDGVFERAPKLRGASVELGAGWVPELLVRLDWVVKHWSRVDANLKALSQTPSETLRERMAFTPFVFEDVGGLIDNSHPELYLFSSDYPHVEGGKDPIKRFEGSLGGRDEAIREAFYAENFLRIFPDSRVG